MFFIKGSCQICQTKQFIRCDFWCTNYCTSAFTYQNCKRKWADFGYSRKSQFRHKIPSYSGTLWCRCHDDKSSGSFQYVHGWCWILNKILLLLFLYAPLPFSLSFFFSIYIYAKFNKQFLKHLSKKCIDFLNFKYFSYHVQAFKQFCDRLKYIYIYIYIYINYTRLFLYYIVFRISISFFFERE